MTNDFFLPFFFLLFFKAWGYHFSNMTWNSPLRNFPCKGERESYRKAETRQDDVICIRWHLVFLIHFHDFTKMCEKSNQILSWFWNPFFLYWLHSYCNYLHLFFSWITVLRFFFEHLHCCCCFRVCCFLNSPFAGLMSFVRNFMSVCRRRKKENWMDGRNQWGRWDLWKISQDFHVSLQKNFFLELF